MIPLTQNETGVFLDFIDKAAIKTPSGLCYFTSASDVLRLVNMAHDKIVASRLAVVEEPPPITDLPMEDDEETVAPEKVRFDRPGSQQIIDDFRKGWLWLKWDLYKDSGKWAYGGWSKVAMDIAKCYRWDGVALLHEMELNQSEVQPGTFQSYRVVVDDSHMQDVPDYHDFFMRLYLVGNQG